MNSLCPHKEPFLIDGAPFSAQSIIDTLGPFLMPDRAQRIIEVIEKRTYTVVPVVEGVFDRGNASAVIRTAEALGFQAIHFVESEQKSRRLNRITQGADKWLDMHRWPTTPEYMAHLTDLGYRIVVTHIENARPISELDFTQPTAICFGNEKEGISDALADAAEERVMVPMLGFTKSFNVSVAAALSLQHIVHDRIERQGRHGDLDADEQLGLRAEFYIRSVKNAKRILLDGLTDERPVPARE